MPLLFFITEEKTGRLQVRFLLRETLKISHQFSLVERLLWEQEVGGSNPSWETIHLGTKMKSIKKKLKELDDMIHRLKNVADKYPEMDWFLLRQMKIDRDLIAAEIGKKEKK